MSLTHPASKEESAASAAITAILRTNIPLTTSASFACCARRTSGAARHASVLCDEAPTAKLELKPEQNCRISVGNVVGQHAVRRRVAAISSEIVIAILKLA